MNWKRSRMLLAGAALCGMSSVALAGGTDQNSELKQMQAEMAALRAQVAQMRQTDDTNWLNERRAEEVKGLIREVLSDAETRSSFSSEGMYAGVDDKGKVFLKSRDGGFAMNFGGQLQMRWIYNHQDNTSDEDVAGFQIRRTKFTVGGHIADPKIKYGLVLATDRGDGDVFMEDAWASYDFTDQITLKAGIFKLPFLREELMSSGRQLAVERAAATEFFTLNRGQQVQISYSDGEMISAMVSLSDGANSEWTEYRARTAELALTGRVELTLMGKASQGADIASWDGEDTYLGLGGAIHYELGDGGAGSDTTNEANYFGWTVDGIFETAGFSVMAALMGGHTDFDAAGVPNLDQYGFLVQGGYFVIPNKLQPFLRWEWIDSDTGKAQLATIGANYYLQKHNAKFTLDLVWAYDNDEALTSNPFGASATSGGLGFKSSTFGNGADDFIAVRAQFQLLF